MTDPHDRPIEDRLRAALDERARSVRPDPDSLAQLEERLMDTSAIQQHKAKIIGGLSAAAAAVIIAVLFIVSGDDGDDDVVTDTTESTTTQTTDTTSTTTTSTTSTTTTTAPPAEVDAYAVAYPQPGSERFSDPTEVATRYATDVLGFTDLIVGEYRAGDSRSGEVPITDRTGGPETTILVRQMEDDAWYVLGSNTSDIVVDTPTAGAMLTSPFETTGSALAFEGHVDVVVLLQLDGRRGGPAPGREPAGEGFVTGSGFPPAGPFSGEISFTAPSGESPGILIYRTLSAEDGHVREATSFPVRLQS